MLHLSVRAAYNESYGHSESEMGGCYTFHDTYCRVVGPCVLIGPNLDTSRIIDQALNTFGCKCLQWMDVYLAGLFEDGNDEFLHDFNF